MEDKVKCLLMETWVIAYEKAIAGYSFHSPKNILDKACCYAVEDWTEHLWSSGAIDSIRGKEFDKIEECVQHHADNLIKGGMWSESNRPIVISDNDNCQVVSVNVPECSYKKSCEWGLNEKRFSGRGKFRCQRMGCFVAAVKKYMRDAVLPDPEKIAYFMTSVHKESGCRGILFVDYSGFLGRTLEDKYLD